ncbi:hypothetical protein [Altericista sp. CCNU0014]|uniref:hypothetical protein n=1 Tax=Altericista sp. CCNU0014 TaxID=3082949 RepID=UPI00384C0A46
MLTFFIHGINTQNSGYANKLIENINRELLKSNTGAATSFYASFWGNLFNNKKNKIIGYIEKDFSRACNLHPKYTPRSDIYRYQKQRKKFINNFLGDFLIYQNIERGNVIRKTIYEQFKQYTEDHPKQKEIHFVTHSLGSIILWDLLFSNSQDSWSPAFLFQKKLKDFDLISISTMGSPLLFFKEMLDLDFHRIDSWLKLSKRPINTSSNAYKLRWVNIIHSSDLVAYPLKAAIEDEISSEILFSDQYVWQDANGAEATLHFMSGGQPDGAMIAAAEDAHSSYFQNNLDGRITARIIAYNLLGETDKLLKRCVTPE